MKTTWSTPPSRRPSLMKSISKSQSRWRLYRNSLKRVLRIPSEPHPIILEGGSVHFSRIPCNSSSLIISRQLCLKRCLITTRKITSRQQSCWSHRQRMFHNYYFLGRIAWFIQTKTVDAVADKHGVDVLRITSMASHTTNKSAVAAEATLLYEAQARTSSGSSCKKSHHYGKPCQARHCSRNCNWPKKRKVKRLWFTSVNEWHGRQEEHLQLTKKKEKSSDSDLPVSTIDTDAKKNTRCNRRVSCVGQSESDFNQSTKVARQQKDSTPKLLCPVSDGTWEALDLHTCRLTNTSCQYDDQLASNVATWAKRI